jgi:cytochrome P450
MDSMEKRGEMNHVKIMDEFQKITGEAVGKIFFGNNLSDHTIEGKVLTLALADICNELITETRSPARILLGNDIYNHFPYPKKNFAYIKKFRGLCQQLIDEKRQSLQSEDKAKNSGKTKDLLHILLEHQAVHGKESMTDKEIIDEFVSFFIAGMDTTGHLVTMVTYELTQHPDVLDKIKDEIEPYYDFKAPPTAITAENLNKMEYLGLVFKESLRTDTPVFSVVPRLVIKDHQLGNIKVKKGIWVNIAYPGLNYNPKSYDEPEKFNPERWLESPTKNNDTFCYVPFGSGPEIALDSIWRNSKRR